MFTRHEHRGPHNTVILLLSALLLAGALFYAGLLARFAWSFRRVWPVPSEAAPLPEDPPFVSVVVAARNEAGGIAACLRSVLENDYPRDHFEVIVVDDGSTDGTAAAVERLQRTYNRTAVPASPAPADAPPERLRLVRLRGNGSGHKHAALQHGIAEARGALLCTTDADCTVRTGWLCAMIGCFTPETAFVAGPVRYRPGGGTFGRLQALEFLGLQAFGAGAIGAGTPNICNSANVAYRREMHAAHGAPASAGAAADELLLQHLARDTDWCVRFCGRPEAIVETDPAPTLHAFLQQRRRWASMGGRYPSVALTASIGALYAFFVLLLAALGLVWLFPPLAIPLLAALVLKGAAEAALLLPACQRFEQPHLMRCFLLAQLLHLPYAVYVGAAGTLGDVRWKGRTLR